MRRVRWDWVVLALILVTLFWFRLEISTSVDDLSYDSYRVVREVEHIQATGQAIRNDPLSITGRVRVGSPLFSYLLASLTLLGEEVYKILPNLLMVLLLIPVYHLTMLSTKSRVASLLSVILAGTGPLVFSSYLNAPSSIPLAIVLFLFTVLMLHNPDKYLFWIVGVALFLTFLSPLIFILVVALLMIIILLRLEGYGVDKRINEFFFFTLILAVWFNVLVYKKALFTGGIRILWQNLPAKYVALQFGKITLLDVVYGLGVVTFLFGAFGVYHALFEKREKSSFSVIGAILAVSLLLVIRVIEIRLGLLLLSLLLSIMAGYGLFVVMRYFTLTKMQWLRYPLGAVVVLLFLFTAVLPALSNAQGEIRNTPKTEDIAAFNAARSIIPRGAILLTTVREGAAVQYFSGHTTLTDDDFLLLTKSDELLRDIDSVYTSPFAVSIIGKSEKLGFTHVLFSNDAAKQYGRDKLRAEESFCLSAAPLSSNVLVYRILCVGERG